MSSNIATGARLRHLDVLRGVAAFLVCLRHYELGFPAQWRDTLYPFGDYGVYVFFIISGYIIPAVMRSDRYRWSSLPGFLGKRIVRLYPPYLAALALTLALGSLAAAWKGGPGLWNAADLPAYLLYVTAPDENPVFWTLQVEMCFYIFIALGFGALNSGTALARWMAFALLCAAWAMRVPLLFLHYVAFFLVGIALEQWQNKAIGGREFAAKLLVSLGIVSLTQRSDEMAFGWSGVIVALATVAFIAQPLIQRWPRPMLAFGAISYSFYLVHFPLGVKFINLMLPRVAPNGTWILALAAFAFSTSVAYLLYVMVERPAMRWARRLQPRPAMPVLAGRRT